MDFPVILEMVKAEIRRANELFPEFPKDMIHGAAIVQEESGELMQAVLNLAYKPPHEITGRHDSVLEVVTEAVHTAAMAIRFLQNFEDMRAVQSEMLPKKPGHEKLGLTIKIH